MKLMRLCTTPCLLLTTFFATSATPATLITSGYNSSNQSVAATAPTVHLGYACYQGYYDSEFGLNVFKGCATTAKDFAWSCRGRIN